MVASLGKEIVFFKIFPLTLNRNAGKIISNLPNVTRKSEAEYL